MAVSEHPVSVIAIGGTPVGIVAIGIVATGVIAISCGFSRGLIAISCGAAVGLFTLVCGVGLGYRVRGVGGGVGVDLEMAGAGWSPRPNPFPKKRAGPKLTKIESLRNGTAPKGILDVRVAAGSIFHAGEELRVVLGSQPRRAIDSLEEQRAYATVRAKTTRESTSYREMSSATELTVERLTPFETGREGSMARWSMGVVVRALIISATLAACFVVVDFEKSRTEANAYHIKDVSLGLPWKHPAR